MSGSRAGRMMRQVTTSAKKLIVPFGKIASGNHLKVNVKNVADSEARELRLITPYGVSSAPLPDLFAQIIFNDHVNNTCNGIWNEKAPEAKPGEIILYSKDNNAQVKLAEDSTIIIFNKMGKVTIAPNGAIKIENSASSIALSPGGAVDIAGSAVTINSAGAFTVNAGGAVDINGSSIDLN